MKIGQGYDIHRLIFGRDLILGGVKIPYEKGLSGHSDADVLIHAIIDSIFGAMNIGDIGEHFPDNDPQYKGISSLELLRHTAKLLDNNGYKIINIDSTVICEKPKLLPYKDDMKKNISNALSISPDLISIKAKTKEKSDSTGEGLSIEAMSVCLIDVKNI
ncbi:TPA: 2-C-methyl-D-erythritol 2,4-cyclodiphosphate synthase [Candidatus Galligastranaerophilus gallistercoris]|nr:2-C-methyl-D-erythritol 2,4-cyclodiphosphate synthase [Candidatus Galligastranaerophilus gallistercoris]